MSEQDREGRSLPPTACNLAAEPNASAKVSDMGQLKNQANKQLKS